MLVYHPIQTDKEGNIVPWYNADPAIAYDHDLHIIWNFLAQYAPGQNGAALLYWTTRFE